VVAGDHRDSQLRREFEPPPVDLSIDEQYRVGAIREPDVPIFQQLSESHPEGTRLAGWIGNLDLAEILAPLEAKTNIDKVPFEGVRQIAVFEVRP
jgi:hypothetical protein